MTARSKALFCGRLLPEIAASSSAWDMDICCECCVLSGRGRADHSSRGDLPSVVCLSVIVKPGQLGDTGGKKNSIILIFS